MDLDLPRIKPGTKMKGEAREKFEAEICSAYKQNLKVGVRDISDATNRSYGAIYDALKRNGVLRPRGGTRR